METPSTLNTARLASDSAGTSVAVSGTCSLGSTSFSGCSMTFLARVAGEPGGHDAGDDHQYEGYGNERQGRTPGPGLGTDVGRGGVHEDLRGQRGVGAVEDVRVGRLNRQDGEQQRCRL